MTRLTLFLLTILLPWQAEAACPELKYIKKSINEIRDRLIQSSEAPIVIKGMKFSVHHGTSGKSVDDLLKGNFEGYIIDRLKETTLGECHYRIRDDRTPVRGGFVLIQQN